MTSRKTILRCLAAAVASASAATALSSYAETIETVIVTSQARDQTVQEVPIAMQVVTIDQINNLAAINLSDINGYIPGFKVDATQPTQANYALRGVGTTEFGIGTDAPVGVYVDGAYTGKTGGALLNFNDVQRIEVLKGPQGTLFGRNSAAGAIAIYSNQPTRETTANGLVRVGSYDTRYFEGVANTPLTDNIAARVSFVNNRSDGWVTNRTNDKKMGGDNDWGTRLAFKWTGADSTEAIFRWEHEDLDQHARPTFGLIKVPDGTPAPVPPQASDFVNPFHSPLQNDAPDRESRKFDGLSLHFDTPITDLTFNSTTSYRHFKSYNRQDNDGTENLATYLDTANDETDTSWEQEFRLSGESDLLDWVSGLSFYYSDATQTSDVVTYTNSIDTLVANTAGVAFAKPFSLANQFGFTGDLYGNTWQESMHNKNTTKAGAAYGDVIWHLTPEVNLTTGLRWSKESKRAKWDTPPRLAPALDPLANELQAASETLNSIAAGLGDPLVTKNLIFPDAARFAAAGASDSKSWVDMSPRAVLDYRISADSMVFLSASRGYQAGGFDIFNPYGTFDPEHMTNYEIGTKNYFPESGLTVNASVFYYKFTGLQSISLVQGSGVVASYEVDNSDQKALGMDLDIAYQLTDRIRLFSGMEALNQQYSKKSFTSHIKTDANGDPLVYSLKNEPVGTPILTVMAGVNADWDMFGGIGQLTLQGTHTSEQRCNDQLREEFGCLDSGPVKSQEAQNRVDLRLGWDTADKRYGTALVVNNVFDQRYISVAPGGQTTWNLGTPYVSITPPRFVGLEFKAAYN